MDINLLIFESQLEGKALNFLTEVDNNQSSQLTKNLVQEILSDVLANNMNIFKIQSTGNVGIALKSIVEEGLIDAKHKQFVALLLSYYALTNHINIPHHDKHALLYINRAQLMAGFVDVFAKLYKDMRDLEASNPHTLQFKPNPTFDIHNIILRDLYPHRDYNEFVHSYFQVVLEDFSSKAFLGLGNYEDPSSWEGENIHAKINKRVKALIEELIPVVSKM